MEEIRQKKLLVCMLFLKLILQKPLNPDKNPAIDTDKLGTLHENMQSWRRGRGDNLYGEMFSLQIIYDKVNYSEDPLASSALTARK